MLLVMWRVEFALDLAPVVEVERQRDGKEGNSRGQAARLARGRTRPA
jgi:hypothetical protein